MSRARSKVVTNRWDREYLLTALPVFLIGFAASVVADRLVFVAWSFACALSYGLLLRATWPRPRVAWRRALLCLYAATFAWLAVVHYRPLQLGLAAFLPAAEVAP